MTKIRIQNKANGERGVYEAGELTFIGRGATRTFSNMNDAEVVAVSESKEFRVQRQLANGEWEELSKIEMPEQRPFLAVATDSDGGNYRIIPLNEGEWFIGTAIASDQPDNATGFDYAKIGGTSVPMTEEAAIASGEFDPVAFLNTAAKNLDFTDKPQEMLILLLETEKANKDRSGVIATIEELLTSPTETEKEEPTE